MRVFFIITVFISVLRADWTRWNIGRASDTARFLSDIEVGIGRRDGTVRVYASDCDGYIYEFTYHQGGWEKTTIGPAPYPIIELAIGTGRNDDIPRLYGITNSYPEKRLYEFSYNSGGWEILEIGRVEGYVGPIIILGQGRNDDLQRIYTSTTLGIYEFTYNNNLSKWDRAIISQHIGSCLAVGPGRNDGINRLYIGGQESIRELTFYYTYWQESKIDSSNWFPANGIVIGPGRNDDTMRVFVELYNDDRQDNIIEYTYRNGSWDSLGLTNLAAESQTIVMGQGRNDGLMRLYYNIYWQWIGETSYLDTGWSITTEPGHIGDGGNLAIGMGQNDGVTRLFASDEDNYLYEFTWVPPAEIISPVRGDTWCSGRTYEIKWNWSKDVRNVDLWCSIDGGLSRSLIVKGAPNTGSYQWTVPDLSVSSDDCFIILADNSNPAYNINYSDTFTILGTNGTGDMVSDNLKLPLLTIYPNPFTKTTEIRYKFAKIDAADLSIYDVSGRSVKNFTNALSRGPGAYQIIWDGRDNKGALLPAGFYFLELTVKSGDRSYRLCKKLVFQR